MHQVVSVTASIEQCSRPIALPRTHLWTSAISADPLNNAIAAEADLVPIDLDVIAIPTGIGNDSVR